MGSGGKLYERQALYNDSHNWKYDSFSGLSVAGNNSYLATHLEQALNNVNQTLSMLGWQDDDDGLTMGKYTSSITVRNSLVFTDLNLSTPVGAAFAMNRYGSKTNILLYTVSTDCSMEQHQYYTANDTLSETKCTSITGASNVPMTMASQNNTSLFSLTSRSECSWPLPLTQLAPVLKENRTYLALS
ncbi:hypothetical protein DBV05_g12094 [Lasiodiplodia theobromae]|uniref:Uncharacterized protein n=1 Tax=Lasiodiplodia theobromae TaxID=45133 RepID=A0A5N5CV74_9PEZI|nr:hypothetical protein DBV05_g12094 [Lasiodiplodia theobromae]